MSVAPVAHLPAKRAPALPAHRIREAREIAAASRWYDTCSDPRCRERAGCVGKLRRIGAGPRCYPGCLAFALGTLLDPAPAADAMVALRRMFPAEAPVETGKEATIAPSVALLVMLMHLAEEDERHGSPQVQGRV